VARVLSLSLLSLGQLLACGAVPPPVQAPPEVALETQTVVLVIACTFRADRTSVYGNTRNTTPYLRALAEQGVVMEDMISNAPWTRPAVASLISGQYPARLGVDDELSEINSNRGLHPAVVTVAERFQEAGWNTVGATANPNANAVFGMSQGFDAYHQASGLWREGYLKVEGEQLLDGWEAEAEKVQGKLFTQLVVVDTHKPLAQEARRPRGFGFWVFVNPGLADRYDAALRVLDRTLADLDRRLTEMGRSDRLLVVIGDHGEGLNEPEWAGHAHGRFLYDGTLRVPWVMHGPGVPQGVRVAGLASSVDLHPTLLELAGLPMGVEMDGQSVVPFFTREPAATDKEWVFSETYFAADHRQRVSTLEWSLFLTHEGLIPRGSVGLYEWGDLEQSDSMHLENPKVVEELSAKAVALSELLRAERQILDLEPLEPGLILSLEALGYVDKRPAPKSP
jgi:arylsulfatase A-like enzyme